MKLICCRECFDIVALHHAERFCSCWKSSGQYVNEIDVVISGPCWVLGIDNFSFADAIKMQVVYPLGFANPDGSNRNLGHRFQAFIIPENAPTIERKQL